jgi:hypothetical protein
MKMLTDPKTSIGIELQANAKRLRRQAVEAEAEWRSEHGLTEALQSKPKRKYRRRVNAWARWQRKQLGKLGPASAVRIIKPE